MAKAATAKKKVTLPADLADFGSTDRRGGSGNRIKHEGWYQFLIAEGEYISRDDGSEVFKVAAYPLKTENNPNSGDTGNQMFLWLNVPDFGARAGLEGEELNQWDKDWNKLKQSLCALFEDEIPRITRDPDNQNNYLFNGESFLKSDTDRAKECNLETNEAVIAAVSRLKEDPSLWVDPDPIAFYAKVTMNKKGYPAIWRANADLPGNAELVDPELWTTEAKAK